MKPGRRSTNDMGAINFISGKIRFKGKLAAVAIAVSFFIIVVAVAISGGFRSEIRKGISRLTGDVILSGVQSGWLSENEPIESNPSYLGRMKEVKGVESITPVVGRTGIVRCDGNIYGVIVKGVPDSSSMCVDIPEKLASLTKLEPGDFLTTYFIGEKVKIRKFKIRSKYPSPVETDGNIIVYAPLQDMQRLNGWDSTMVSAMEVRLDSRHSSRKDMKMIAGELGAISTIYASDGELPLAAESAGEKYGQIFDWLDLIDFNVVAILILMTIVAGFNMISGLLIFLFRNISTIGTLKALGMNDKNIRKVFIKVSSRLILTGMVTGNVLAMLFCLVQHSTHILKLNPDNYFVSFVPVELDFPSILVADILSFGAIILLMTIPTVFITKTDPAKTIKAD